MTVQYIQPKTNHALHLILSVLTLGLWLPVWAIVAAVQAGRQPQAYPTSPTQAQPGWYPDPWRHAPFRWWDGTQWTAGVQ